MAWSPVAALARTEFVEELAQVREQATQRTALDRALTASSMAAGASLSILYGAWLLRGGALLTSLLASLPAWRSIDPTPVLGRIDARGRDDGRRDDSLRGMLKRAAQGRSAAAAINGTTGTTGTTVAAGTTGTTGTVGRSDEVTT